jgi:uncharacterized protein (TIGR02246 family)
MTMRVEDPERLARLFAERVNAGDLEGMLALYEDDATFVGPDGACASGNDAIRERLKVLLSVKPQLTTTSSELVMAGDIALMTNRWRMTLRAAGGEVAEVDGQSTEVARRQPNDGWLYVIDRPKLVS